MLKNSTQKAAWYKVNKYFHVSLVSLGDWVKCKCTSTSITFAQILTWSKEPRRVCQILMHGIFHRIGSVVFIDTLSFM